jgi:hypothetical protein
MNESEISAMQQGCQMVYFQTKSTNVGKFWRTLDWKMLEHFMGIWNILRTFRICYDHLVHFSGFGITYQEKSGNPGHTVVRPSLIVSKKVALTESSSPDECS